MNESIPEKSPRNSTRQKIKHVNNHDLQEFLKSFDSWQHITECLMKEKTNLADKVSMLSNEKVALLNKNQELNNQIGNLQTVLKSTHKSLHRICDIEEENRHIKSKSEILQTEILKLNGLIDLKAREHEKQIEEISKENEIQKEGVKNSMKIILEQERENHVKEINQKNSEIKDLHEKLMLARKDNESEIVRISMEYENKLTKLRQKIPTSAMQGSSSNQEIFRMKLQHMKNGYEREVRLLKERIQELEQKSNVPQGGNRMTFTSNNKKRRY